MGPAATPPPHHHHTSTVDCQAEAPSCRLLHDGKALGEVGLALSLARGLQLPHTAPCRGGGGLTRHSPYGRGRLGGLSLWHLQCPRCTAVVTGLPPAVLRYRSLRPEGARAVLVATPGGLSWERGQ